MSGPHDTLDPQDQARIERWLVDRANAAPRPDRSVVVRNALQQLPTTNQRRRWWNVRWLQLDRGALRSAEVDGIQAHRRSRTMFTATRLVAVVALAALGSAAVLSAALPRSQDQIPVAAALPDASEASTFTGTRSGAAVDPVPPTITNEGGVQRRRDEMQNGLIVEASDSRFSGTMDFTFNTDIYGPQRTGAFWGVQRITNDEGAWEGPLVGTGNPFGHWRASAQFVGEGAYEGLVAIAFFDSDLTFEGAILPGELPPRE